MRSARPFKKFQTELKWSPFMISSLTKQTGKYVKLEKDKVSDDLLRVIVDACVSNVAVLDESGTVLYASKAWRLLQGGAEGFEIDFENCKRFTVSQFDEDADITLEDDIQEILFGDETEFHRKYYCQSGAEQKPFVMHAARLKLPGSSFRVVITLDEIPFARADTRHSNE